MTLHSVHSICALDTPVLSCSPLLEHHHMFITLCYSRATVFVIHVLQVRYGTPKQWVPSMWYVKKWPEPEPESSS